MENTKEFIEDLNMILIKNGGGRYDHLMDTPFIYVPIVSGKTGDVIQEYVSHGASMVNITGDSLTGILSDLCAAGVI